MDESKENSGENRKEKPTVRTVDEVYAACQELSADDRKLLIAMLEQDQAPAWASPEIEQAWKEEIARRIKLMDEGKMKLYDGDEVLRRLRDLSRNDLAPDLCRAVCRKRCRIYFELVVSEQKIAPRAEISA